MAVEALGSAPRVKVAPWNDPVIRGWVFQIVVVGLVGLLAWYLVSNTIDNLERQKIASGFHYLEREAGFEIGDTMIEYSPASTYARAIWVGMLNTLKVSVLGVIMATILGTADRRRQAVEQLAARQDLRMVRRGLPQRAAAALAVPVLQADQRGLPGAATGDRRVLEYRLPVQPRSLLPGADCRSDPQMDGRRAADRHRWRLGPASLGEETPGATGQPFPSISAGFGVALGLPFIVWLLGGAPHHMSWPELKGFNFDGGTVHPAGVHRPAARPGALHLGLRRRDRALGHPGAAQGPERGRHGARADRAAR